MTYHAAVNIVNFQVFSSSLHRKQMGREYSSTYTYPETSEYFLNCKIVNRVQ